MVEERRREREGRGGVTSVLYSLCFFMFNIPSLDTLEAGSTIAHMIISFCDSLTLSLLGSCAHVPPLWYWRGSCNLAHIHTHTFTRIHTRDRWVFFRYLASILEIVRYTLHHMCWFANLTIRWFARAFLTGFIYSNAFLFYSYGSFARLLNWLQQFFCFRRCACMFVFRSIAWNSGSLALKKSLTNISKS